jgi:hypothetical protein
MRPPSLKTFEIVLEAKKMTRFAFLFLSLSLAAVTYGHAGELDPQPSSAPQGLIVRVNEHGLRQVFKAGDVRSVNDAQSAEASVKANVVAQNLLTDVQQVSELDRVTSNQAWYYWWNPYYSNYFYGYNYLGYNYFYRPWYTWAFNGYNYYYYYRW